jgi:hypothetical protein
MDVRFKKSIMVNGEHKDHMSYCSKGLKNHTQANASFPKRLLE